MNGNHKWKMNKNALSCQRKTPIKTIRNKNEKWKKIVEIFNCWKSIKKNENWKKNQKWKIDEKWKKNVSNNWELLKKNEKYVRNLLYPRKKVQICTNLQWFEKIL